MKSEEGRAFSRQSTPVDTPVDAAKAAPAPAPIAEWSIRELTRGGREARILHAGSLYVLRITSNDKLILTK